MYITRKAALWLCAVCMVPQWRTAIACAKVLTEGVNKMLRHETDHFNIKCRLRMKCQCSCAAQPNIPV